MRRPVLFLTVLLLCSTCLNIVLARKINGLNTGIAYLKAELSSVRGLKAGDYAPAIKGTDLDGKTASIEFIGSGNPSVLYIFTPECSWCKKNLESTRTLIDQTRDTHRFIGLSLSSSGLKDYVIQNQIHFPVYSANAETALAYNGGTPRTLVVSTNGVILKSWFGAYRGNVQREVEAYFGIRLPVIDELQPERVEGSERECEGCDPDPNQYPR